MRETDHKGVYDKWTGKSTTPVSGDMPKTGSRRLPWGGSDTSLCVPGSQVYNMPKDQVDRIMDQVHERQIAITAPVAIPKKTLRKHNAYLPKPPPPKLSAQPFWGYPKHRWADKWTVKKEEQEDRSQDETPRSVPETERDWFPNSEYKEQPFDEDDEQKQQEQWDSLWDVEEGEEWEEWEQEQEHEAEDIPAQQNAEEEKAVTEQGQQEDEEEWPQGKDEETQNNPHGDE